MHLDTNTLHTIAHLPMQNRKRKALYRELKMTIATLKRADEVNGRFHTAENKWSILGSMPGRIAHGGTFTQSN